MAVLLSLTIGLMLSQLLKVPIAGSSLVHNRPTRDLAEEGAGIFCKRMNSQTVDDH